MTDIISESESIIEDDIVPLNFKLDKSTFFLSEEKATEASSETNQQSLGQSQAISSSIPTPSTSPTQKGISIIFF